MRSESGTPALAAPLASRAGEHAPKANIPHNATRKAQKERTVRTITRSCAADDSKMRAGLRQPDRSAVGVAGACSYGAPRPPPVQRSRQDRKRQHRLNDGRRFLPIFDGNCRVLTATRGPRPFDQAEGRRARCVTSHRGERAVVRVLDRARRSTDTSASSTEGLAEHLERELDDEVRSYLIERVIAARSAPAALAGHPFAHVDPYPFIGRVRREDNLR